MTTDLIIQIAQQEILPRFKHLKAGEITEKSPGDMVTIADIKAENLLILELRKLFPTAVICGEESIARCPELLSAVILADHGFLIDPVDGTNNFIKGNDNFALMVTELRKGEAVCAWVYLPVTGKMAMAEKGAGTQLNGQNIKIYSKEFIPSNMTAAVHVGRFPDHLGCLARKNIVHFKANKPAFCAGYDYISLIEGNKDFSIYYRTLPWDHLPGCLLFTEAGGYVRTLTDHENYTIHDRNKGLLSANSKEEWLQIREILFPQYF